MYLYQRKNSPFWWVEYYINGDRFRRSTETASRRDASRIAKQFQEDDREHARKTKVNQKSNSITLDEACGRYWIEHARHLGAARDEQRYLKYIIEILTPGLPLGELSNVHVNTLVQKRLEMGAGPAGVNRTISALQTMHNSAAKRWGIPVLVIDWSEHKLDEPEERVRWITQRQATLLVQTLDRFAQHIARVVEFLFLTGVRKNEAFTARWDKIDWEKATITLEVKGRRVNGKRKTRTVELSSEAVLLLKSMQEHADGPDIFDTTNWRKHFDRACEETGLEDFRWHDIRHTFATLLGRAGVPLEVVSKAVGHSSVKVTEKYRHVVSDEVRNAINRFPSLRSQVADEPARPEPDAANHHTNHHTEKRDDD